MVQKGEALDVIPVGMADQNSADNSAGVFLGQGDTQASNAGTGVDDD
jgi:hypothetical protein